MRTFHHRWPTALVAALMLLLPVLAGLQYRWLGLLSQSEATRLRTTLQATTQRFAEDFDRTLETAQRAFQIERTTDGNPATMGRTLGRSYAAWQADTDYPGFFEALYHVTPSPDGPRLARLDGDRLTPLPWPAHLAVWRTHFAHPDAAPPDDPLALTIPIAHFVAAPGQPPEGRIEHLLLPLDGAYLAETFFPERARLYFADDGAFTHDLVVVARADPGHLLYRTDPTLDPAALDPPDATASLGRMPRIRISLSADTPGDGTANTLVRREQTRKRIEMEMTRTEVDDGGLADSLLGGDRAGGMAPQPGAWEVRVRPRDGALATLVARQRSRNLALSFGILGILGVAMGLLFVSARRARRLADQQMAFVAGVSHEFRTPLAVIQSAAENLADGVVHEAEGTRRYGTLIRDEGRRLTEMVEQVLALAGAQSGQRAYRFAPVSAEALIADSLAALASEIDRAGVTVTTEIAPGLPPVLADAAALEAALRNLIGNAMKHGGTARWVGLAATASPGIPPEVHLTVSDRGPGIPDDERPHVFEPFFRGRQARAAQVPGSGLGLSLVHHTAQAHGGRVTVAARPGAGSIFTLHLPAAPRPA